LKVPDFTTNVQYRDRIRKWGIPAGESSYRHYYDDSIPWNTINTTTGSFIKLDGKMYKKSVLNARNMDLSTDTHTIPRYDDKETFHIMMTDQSGNVHTLNGDNTHYSRIPYNDDFRSKAFDQGLYCTSKLQEGKERVCLYSSGLHCERFVIHGPDTSSWNSPSSLQMPYGGLMFLTDDRTGPAQNGNALFPSILHGENRAIHPNRISLSKDGFCGFGMSSATATAPSSNGLDIFSDGQISFYTYQGSTSWVPQPGYAPTEKPVTVTSYINEAGLYTPGSDDRLKFNETNLTNCLHVIGKLSPETYNWFNVFGKKGIGFIAQEIEEILELKHTVDSQDTRAYADNGNVKSGFKDQKFVSYEPIFVYNVGATQELHKIVKNEQTKIENLETKVNEQEVKLTEQENKLSEQEVKLSEQEVKLSEQSTKIAQMETLIEQMNARLIALESN